MLDKFNGMYFRVTSLEVKENDENLYDYLLDELEGFAADPSNQVTEQDVKDFEEGKWLVEYGVDGDQLCYTAGRDGQMLANQPYWCQDSLADVESNVSQETLRWYIENFTERGK